MNIITKFFHELFNPHCEHCIELARENRICGTCEYLKTEVAQLRNQNQELIEKITNKPAKVEIKQEAQIFKPLSPGTVKSWAVRRQLLENEDRSKAKILQENSKKLTTELEDKLFDKELADIEKANAE